MISEEALSFLSSNSVARLGSLRPVFLVMPYLYVSDSDVNGSFDAQALENGQADGIADEYINPEMENGRAWEVPDREKDDANGSAVLRAGFQPKNGSIEPTEGPKVKEDVNRDPDGAGKGSNRSKRNGAAKDASDSSQMNRHDQAYEVKWDDDEGKRDPSNPYNMRNARKWSIMFVVSMSAFCV